MRERGLKFMHSYIFLANLQVAPVRERGLKFVHLIEVVLPLGSLP